MDQLKELLPTGTVDENSFMFDLTDTISGCLQVDTEELILWDLKGTDFADVVTKCLAAVDASPHKKDDRPRLIIQELMDRYVRKDAGMDDILDIDIAPYDGSADTLWLRLKRMVNVGRKLKITTYGTRYIFETPEGVEEVYNAKVLRGKRNNQTVKLRGTHPQLQRTIRDCDLFVSFVTDMVVDIEKNDYHHVAVICQGGHHRSVAVAEMLVHLYPERTTSHLTIHT